MVAVSLTLTTHLFRVKLQEVPAIFRGLEGPIPEKKKKRQGRLKIKVWSQITKLRK